MQLSSQTLVKQRESAGQLVVFEGMSRFRLHEGLIADYTEVFDRGIAFVQLGYQTPRVRKLLDRYAQAFRSSDLVREHTTFGVERGGRLPETGA